MTAAPCHQLTHPYRRDRLFDAASAVLRRLPPVHEASPGCLVGVVRGFGTHSEPGQSPYDCHAPEFAHLAEEDGRLRLRIDELKDLPPALHAEAALAYTTARADSRITRLANQHARRYHPDPEGDSFQAFILRDAIIFDDADFTFWPDTGGAEDAAQKTLISTETVLSDAISNHALLETIKGVETFLSMRLPITPSVQHAELNVPSFQVRLA